MIDSANRVDDGLKSLRRFLLSSILGVATMASVTVFYYEKHDVHAGRFVRSTRLATRHVIELFGAKVVAGSALVVDASRLDRKGFARKSHEHPRAAGSDAPDRGEPKDRAGHQRLRTRARQGTHLPELLAERATSDHA